MNLIEDCLSKVKKDCYKFILTQETSSDKFKNKDKMLKKYLVPLSFWIAKEQILKNPIQLVLQEDREQEKQLLALY